MKNRVSLTLFIFSLLSLSLLNSCDLLNKVFKIAKEIPQENPLTGKSLGITTGTSSGGSSGTPSGTSSGGSSGTSTGTPSGTSTGTPSGTSTGTPSGTSTGGVTLDINKILTVGTYWIEGGVPLVNKKDLLIEGNHLLCKQRVSGSTGSNAVELHMFCGHNFESYTIDNSTQFTTSGKTYTITSPTTIIGDGATFTLIASPTIDQMTHPGSGKNGLWIDYQNSFPHTPSLHLSSTPLHVTIFYFKHNHTVCRTENPSATAYFSDIRSSCSPADFHPYTIDDDTHMTIEGEQYTRNSAISFNSGNHNFFPLAVYY